MDYKRLGLDVTTGGEDARAIARRLNGHEEMRGAFGEAELWEDQSEQFRDLHRRVLEEGEPIPEVMLSGGEETSWPEDDLDEAMRALSAEFPRALFAVTGVEDVVGEGAFWRSYHKAGQIHKTGGRVVFPPFDETNLA